KAGDELTIGNFKYQISWDVPPEPAAVPLANGKKAHADRVLSKPVDQLLEDADEPIPLDDDSVGSRILEAMPAEPLPKSPAATPAGVQQSTESHHDESAILPSKLDLAPPSEAPPTTCG